MSVLIAAGIVVVCVTAAFWVAVAVVLTRVVRTAGRSLALRRTVLALESVTARGPRRRCVRLRLQLVDGLRSVQELRQLSPARGTSTSELSHLARCAEAAALQLDRQLEMLLVGNNDRAIDDALPPLEQSVGEVLAMFDQLHDGFRRAGEMGTAALIRALSDSVDREVVAVGAGQDVFRTLNGRTDRDQLLKVQGDHREQDRSRPGRRR